MGEFLADTIPIDNLSPILHEPKHDLGGRLGGGGQEGGVIGEGVLVPAVGDGAKEALDSNLLRLRRIFEQ